MSVETTAASTTSPALERYEAVIGIEVHCQLGPRRRCSARARPPTTARRRTPTSARSASAFPARCRSSTGGPSSSSWRPGVAIEADDARGDPLGSQELLLPGPAQGLPDQPVRPAPGLGGPAHVRDVRRAGHDRHHPRPPRGGHGQARPRDRAGRPAGEPRRLQPLRRAAHGDRHRPGHPHGRAGPALRRGAPAAAAHDRRVRRGHGARPDAGRGERLAPPARHRGVRDPGRGQEHELVPLGRARDRLRDRAPGGRPRRRRDADPGDPRLVRRPRRDVPHALEGDVRRLPLLPGAGPAAAPRRRGLAGRDPARRCRSCRRRAARATATPSGCRPTTRPSSSRDRDAERAVRGDAAPPAAALDPKAVANWVTGEYLRLRKATADAPSGSTRPSSPRSSARVDDGRALAGATPRRSSRRTWRPANRSRRSSPRRGLRQISRHRRPRRRPSTRSWRPTPTPSRTTGRARPRPSGSSSARS